VANYTKVLFIYAGLVAPNPSLAARSKSEAVTLSDLFKRLGAPLANVRWSWGSVRSSDSAVFLRVWQDETKVIAGKRYVRVISTAAFEGREDNLGYVERIDHVDRIRHGAQSYMIMCVAKDAKARPRSIATFNSDDVFVGGALVDEEGFSWMELAGRRPVDDVRA
jgi:hypothetical protein